MGKRDNTQTLERAVDQATSPYEWALPPGADVEPDPLVLRVDFHSGLVIVHDYDAELVRTKVVSARDVAHALARELSVATGVLPPGALWWANTPTGSKVALWQEPDVHEVSLVTRYGQEPARLRLPMPGLVFVCGPGAGTPYVFAAKARPKGADEQLFACPTYNVFESGKVCVGSHRFPSDPALVPEEFWRSRFSVTGDTARNKSREHPDDIGQLWQELQGRTEYPLDDLVPLLTVSEAMNLDE